MTTKDEVLKVFSIFGPTTKIILFPPKSNSLSAMVSFKGADAAKKAIKLKHILINEKKVMIQEFIDKSARNPK